MPDGVLSTSTAKSAFMPVRGSFDRARGDSSSSVSKVQRGRKKTIGTLKNGYCYCLRLPSGFRSNDARFVVFKNIS